MKNTPLSGEDSRASNQSEPTESQPDCSRTCEKDQPKSKTFLIGSTDFHERLTDTCPSAQTITAWSETLEQIVIIQQRCKRWGCRHCGERKLAHFGYRVQEAEPSRLITLTVNNSRFESPREAYDETKGKVTQLATKLRRIVSEFEYFKVLEVTKKGWPHYHLVARCPYIRQTKLSDMWSTLTGARIVDVRKIRRPTDVYSYIIKYLGKQHYIPWTDRRVSWSKNFFRPQEFEPGQSLNLADMHFSKRHPREFLEDAYEGFEVEAYSRDCWTISKEDTPIWRMPWKE